MKKIIFVCFNLSLILISTLYGQEYKRNYNWSLGYDPVVTFDFNNLVIIDTVKNNGISSPIYCLIKSSSSSISDTNGDLLFFSNGFILYDNEGYAMDNAIRVNCPKGNVLANYYGASLFDQTSIILPKKGNTYYVFSTGMSDSVANIYLNHIKTEFDVLNYSVVDMDSNNGKGKVVQKNVILADNRHYVDCALHAVKHANGKDWWLVKADCDSNRYEEYIVREDTILGPFYQEVPSDKVGDFCTSLSEILFSPDGTKMASTMYGTLIPPNFYYRNNVFVFDFDRCNGNITFRNNYRVPEDTSSYPNADIKVGISFSSNGKLLYESNSYTIYQIDLDDTNAYSALLIHGPDTVINKFPEYSDLGLAPNGKIYIGNFNGTRKYMSYIDKPNVKGLGCDFVANGVWQPYTNLLDPPNMPNYGLGADSSLLVGCEPVAIEEPITKSEERLVVYPNPVSGILNVEMKTNNGKNVKIEMYNCVGQLVLASPLERGLRGVFKVDVSHLVSGIYFLKFGNQVRKVIIE